MPAAERAGWKGGRRRGTGARTRHHRPHSPLSHLFLALEWGGGGRGLMTRATGARFGAAGGTAAVAFAERRGSGEKGDGLTETRLANATGMGEAERVRGSGECWWRVRPLGVGVSPLAVFSVQWKLIR
jgi:hypothetical protein